MCCQADSLVVVLLSACVEMPEYLLRLPEGRFDYLLEDPYALLGAAGGNPALDEHIDRFVIHVEIFLKHINMPNMNRPPHLFLHHWHRRWLHRSTRSRL